MRPTQGEYALLSKSQSLPGRRTGHFSHPLSFSLPPPRFPKSKQCLCSQAAGFQFAVHFPAVSVSIFSPLASGTISIVIKCSLHFTSLELPTLSESENWPFPNSFRGLFTKVSNCPFKIGTKLQASPSPTFPLGEPFPARDS